MHKRTSAIVLNCTYAQTLDAFKILAAIIEKMRSPNDGSKVAFCFCFVSAFDWRGYVIR